MMMDGYWGYGMYFWGALAVIIGIFILGAVIVLLIKVYGSSSKPPKHVESYQRIAQLDDLHKRGAISDEEYEQKKQEHVTHL